MSTLQVANIHLESTANNRIQYAGSNTYSLVAGGTSVLSVNSTTVTVSGNLSVSGTSAIAVAPGANTNVLTSNGTAWVSGTATALTPTGTISIQPLVSSRIYAASGTGSTATVYFYPAFTIPNGSKIAVVGVTPSGYNAPAATTTATSTLIFFCRC